jgi:hypothetical protein
MSQANWSAYHKDHPDESSRTKPPLGNPKRKRGQGIVDLERDIASDLTHVDKQRWSELVRIAMECTWKRWETACADMGL